MIIPPQQLVKYGYNVSQLDCSGIKLTLAEVYKPLGPGTIDLDSKSIPNYETIQADDKGYYRLGLGSYIIRYGEYVKIPEDAIALAIPRSTLIRSGAMLFTAVWDPGYEGRGFGLLIVYNPHGLIIRRGAQVAQLVFIRMSEPSMLKYRGTYYKER